MFRHSMMTVTGVVVRALLVAAFTATAVLGWEPLPPVPNAMLQQDCDLICAKRPAGDGYVFALAFETDRWEHQLFAYGPTTWSGNIGALPWWPSRTIQGLALANPANVGGLYALATTFQQTPGYTKLCRYRFTGPAGYSGRWDEPEDVGWNANWGMAMVYRPNRDYAPAYPIPGWLYALKGGGTGFVRYSLPAPHDTAIDGIYPPDGSVIANAEPLFVWKGVPRATKYSLQVSRDSVFNILEVDVQALSPAFKVKRERALENGTHYWRTAATQQGQPRGQWSPVNEFGLTQGWVQMAPCLQAPGDLGYALCYTARPVGPGNAVAESIYMLPGSGSRNAYRYNVGSNTWVQTTSTPKEQAVTDMAYNPNPAMPMIYSMFGAPHLYEFNGGPWVQGNLLPTYRSTGSHLAFDDAGEYLYCNAGAYNIGFYRLHVGQGGGGQSVQTDPVSGQSWLSMMQGDIAIHYALVAPSRVRAVVYDQAGRKVRELFCGQQGAGEHRLAWDCSGSDGTRSSRGVYFVVLDRGTVQDRLKAVVR